VNFHGKMNHCRV